MKTLIVLCLAAVLFSGCAAFNKIVTNNELISQLAVESATARVLHGHPEWTARAIQLTDAAVKIIDANAAVQIADLEAYVRANINWKGLLPEEQAVLSALITQVRQNLEDSFRAHNIGDPLKQNVVVREVLTWINETAKRQ